MRVLLLCLLSFFLSGGLFAKSKMHFQALLVCDSQQPSELHSAYMNDVCSMKKHVKKISSGIGSVLHLKILKGENATARCVGDWIQDLPKGSKNIVFLYYVGRGTWSDGSPWPAMLLEKASSPQDVMTQSICKGRHRLVLSFFDCYDRLWECPRKMKFIEERDACRKKFKHAKKFFLKSKGCVMGSSASSGGLSYGIKYQGKTVGGLFSTMLFDTLKNGERSWNWQFGVMIHHMVLLREPKQNFLFSSKLGSRHHNEPVCK